VPWVHVTGRGNGDTCCGHVRTKEGMVDRLDECGGTNFSLIRHILRISKGEVGSTENSGPKGPRCWRDWQTAVIHRSGRKIITTRNLDGILLQRHTATRTSADSELSMSSEDHWQLMQLGVISKNQTSQALTPRGLEACGKLVATTELSVSTSPIIIEEKAEEQCLLRAR